MQRERALFVIFGALATAGCTGGEGTESVAVTRSAPTVAIAGTITDSPIATGDYQPGYPKKVPLAKAEIPDGLKESLFSLGGRRFAWAVAPGVWVRYKPPASLADPSRLTNLYGDCDALDAFGARVGYQQWEMTCWEW